MQSKFLHWGDLLSGVCFYGVSSEMILYRGPPGGWPFFGNTGETVFFSMRSKRHKVLPPVDTGIKVELHGVKKTLNHKGVAARRSYFP